MAEFRLCHSLRFGGLDFALAPFIPLVSGDRVHERLLKDVLPQNCGGVRTVPQVIGKDPGQLRAMASALRAIGYTEMDLNCGCPWKFVAKKGRGSGLPENEDAFRAMLEAGCEAMPDGFSIKIRLGMKTPDTLAKRAELINQFPLREITIHPRTGIQMYDGKADVEAFAAVLPLFKVPVVYNGDIKTVSDYARIVERFPSIAGVMIGRGLVQDSFLAHDIRAWEEGGRGTVESPPHDGARADEVLAFADELYRRYRETLCGPSPVLGRMKELWGYLYRYFENGETVLRAVQRSASLADYDRAVATVSKNVQPTLPNS